MAVARRAALFSVLWIVPLLGGCNGGLIGLAIYFALEDDDDDDSPGPQLAQGPARVEFVDLENRRTRPGETVLVFSLSGDVRLLGDVLVAYRAGAGDFVPVEFQEPFPEGSGREPPAPGVLADLLATPDGTVHRVGWDAARQLGGLGLERVTLRLEAENVVEVDLLIGNDAPRAEAVRLGVEKDGTALLEFVLKDSSDDPADIAIAYATDLDSPAPEDFSAVTTGDELAGLATSEAGVLHGVRWQASRDLGRIDRQVLVRIQPRDLVGEPAEGLGQAVDTELFLDLNRPPSIELVDAGGVEDRRRGLGISIVLSDDEGDPADAIVQWTPAGGAFPVLPERLAMDPAEREDLLLSVARAPERALLRIATFRPAVLEGPVEEPSGTVALEPQELLASWIRERGEVVAFEHLERRRLRIERGDGTSEERLVCSYAPRTGILRLDAPLEPPPAPGDVVRIELGGPLHLAAPPEGSRHGVVWASDVDLPGGGTVRLRVTPYDRTLAATGAARTCELPPGVPLENARSGDAGLPAEGEVTLRLDGPYGQRGAWTFPLAPVDEPAALAAGDLDGDGRLDLAALSRSSRSLVLGFQTAPGAFDPLRLLDARIGEPSSLAIADLDRDGDPDLAVTSAAFLITDVPEGIPPLARPGSVLLYHQAAGGDWIPDRIALTAGGTLVDPATVVALEGGRGTSLAVIERDAGGAKLALFSPAGGASGCLGSEGQYDVCTLEVESDGLRHLALADIDGDGARDLLSADGAGFLVFWGAGEGVLNPPARFDVPGVSIESVAAVDTDADGLRDLAGASPSTGELVLLRQRAPGEFEMAPPPAPAGLERPAALLVADCDGNGREDLVVADRGAAGAGGGGRLFVCFATETGISTSSVLERKADPPAVPVAVAAGDFDGDGLVDLAAAYEGPRDVQVHLQEVPGTFSRPGEVLGRVEAGRPSGVAAADLDGDGDLDLAVVGPASSDLVIFEQAAPGDFRALAFPAFGEAFGAHGPVEVIAADLDGDGRFDLATADQASDTLSVFLADAGGFLARRAVLRSDLLRGPQSLAAGDIDGDGRLDLAAAGRFSDSIVWFPQLEDGAFGPAQLLHDGSAGAGTLAGPTDVLIADMDRDGRGDIVAAGHVSGTILWLRQLETRGAFAPAVELALPGGFRPGGLAAADLDGDGDMDLAVAGSGPGGAVVLLRQDGGAFRAGEPLGGTGAPAVSLAAGDFDGDGRTDLVLASAAGNALAVFLASAGGGFLEPVGLAGPQAGGASGFTPPRVIAIDLDRDGERDLVAPSRDGGEVIVFWGGR